VERALSVVGELAVLFRRSKNVASFVLPRSSF
jgi:hypothetical protein